MLSYLYQVLNTHKSGPLQTIKLALKYGFKVSYKVCFICLLGFEPEVCTQFTFSGFSQQLLEIR